MRKIIIFFVVLTGIVTFSHAQNFPTPPGRGYEISITCSEPGTTIFANGNQVGIGSANVKVPKNNSVKIKVVKQGFVTEEKTFYGSKQMEKTHNFVLTKDVLGLTCSESDASILLNGVEVGKGNAEVNIPEGGSITVKVQKIGYVTEERVFSSSQNPPKTYHFILFRDESFDASASSDIANVDVDIKTTKSESDAWKLLSQIITSYFDVIEVSDKETGYIRTSWVIQQFKYNTIRTRVIVKLGNINPIEYKIKLVSECSYQSGTSAKSDELFKPWDRVLRKYENFISEVQSRLK